MTAASTKPRNRHALPKGVERIATKRICGHKVPVYRATTEQVPELSDAFGWDDEARGVIWVRDGQTEDQERDTVTHEVTHAFLRLSGLRNTLKTMLGPKRAKHWYGDDGIEETLVRQATPHLVAMCGKPWA